jgi:hypothetical protein
MATKPEVIRATDDEARALAKGLIRASASAALATLSEDGAPLASLTSVAADMDGAPVILVSHLSGHTANLAADPRCSLLFARGGKGDPLAHPRVSVMGRMRQVDRAGPEGLRVRARFLSRQPKAALYVDFPDFVFLKLDITHASLNGGFGKAFALTAADLTTDLAGAEALAAAEADIIAHMNDDHADTVKLYATRLARRDAAPWRLVSLDPEGVDLAAGAEMARVDFPRRVATPEAARVALIALAKAARAV